jgi:hypothetical protein
MSGRRSIARGLGFWGDVDTLRIGIGLFTLLSLAMIAPAAVLAWRQWGFGGGDPPHDDPTRRDRLLFQGYATLLLSGLSFVWLGCGAWGVPRTSSHKSQPGGRLRWMARSVLGVPRKTSFRSGLSG